MKAVINSIIMVFMASMLCVYAVMNMLPQKIQTPEGVPAAMVRKAHYLAHELLLMIRGKENPLLSIDVRDRGRLQYRMTSFNEQGMDHDGDKIYYLHVESGLINELTEGRLAGAEWQEGNDRLRLNVAGREMLHFPGKKVYLLDGMDISALIDIAHVRELK